jgi:uncharacterized protein with HEPN domain
MDLEIKKWLKDIDLSISEINSFFPEKKIFLEFQSDIKNRIVHGYDSISADVIWLIIIQHLPVLEMEVKELLG